MDHRVEPTSWLPQGAAPEAADPEADEAPASDDAPELQDEAPAEGAAEEFANGNGRDNSHTYARDDSYGQEESYAVRGPFEEATKPPFDELPASGFDSPPAPAPPAEFGMEEPGAGFVGSGADAGLDDGEFDGSGAGASLADGGYGSAVVGGDLYGGTHLASDAATASYAHGYPASAVSAAATAVETGTHDSPRAPYAYPPPPAPMPPPAPIPVPAAPIPVPAGAAARARPPAIQARRANLVIARLEPWSVMKFSFLMSLVAWIVLFVAVAILYYALSSIGVFDSLQRTLSSVTASQASSGVDLSKWTSGTRILGYTMLIGAVDVVLITALSTVGAVVYNLVTHLGGGIEITLKETE